VIKLLSRELKSLRALNGHTQKDLANMLGIGETSYTKRENGDLDFSVEEIKKLKELYKLSDEDIIRIFFDNEVA